MKEIHVITVREWQVRQMLHDIYVIAIILTIFIGVIGLCQVLVVPQVVL